jgi:two-component system sensor histidine kinase UhpB
VNVHDRDSHFRIVSLLLAGFTLLVCLLLASAFVAFQAIQSIERNALSLMLEQNASTRLVDELQQEEDALSAVFYALVAQQGSQPPMDLLRQLDEVSARVHASTEAGQALGTPENWLGVRRAANTFIGEVRRTLISGGSPSARLFTSHDELVNTLTEIASQSYQRAVEAQTVETKRTGAWVRNMLVMLAVALAIAVAVAVLAIRGASRILRTMAWQTNELARLNARMMSVQEETARRFSRELHDQFGQTLSAIEANMVAMRDAGENQPRIADCLVLVKDAMANVRQISQLLRPSVLDDFGLDASLRWLGETFSQRTGIQVQYESTFAGRLSDEVETQLFRIAQEALTNIARHSDASRVRVDLLTTGSRLALTIADNGRGLPDDQSRAGTGLISMRARARETGGVLTVRSSRGQGVTIKVDLPLETEKEHAAENPHFVGR